ncbi:MAG: PorV/PorQ family protein, partial [Candidatus Neomarinimicrobiota bacterium]
MGRFTRVFLIIALLGGSISRGADVTKVGTTAAKFLAIGAGSRAVSMGGAFVATADDATAMYWNVSGLAQLSQPELLVNYTRWFADIVYAYLGFVYPLGRLGTVGFNVVSMSMEEMRVTAYGVEGDFTGETFRAGSYAIGLSYARQITDRFALGGNV